jgi:hypothetical protein
MPLTLPQNRQLGDAPAAEELEAEEAEEAAAAATAAAAAAAATTNAAKWETATVADVIPLPPATLGGGA